MYYTTKEVADMLKVCHVTVLRMIKCGKLKANKLGHRTIRIKADDLQAYIDGGQ